MHLQERFNQILTTHLPAGARVLLAVSGGLDSVVMMNLFQAAGATFAVAHGNFQLRADAADDDEAFVAQLAQTAGVPCFAKRFDTKDFAHANGVSTQMAARTLRYEWFETLAIEHGYDWVVTAHHLNDQVETVLLNFIRGTGLSGMKGMRATTTPGSDESPLQQVGLFRPLLDFTKTELLTYAQEQRIMWREDASNAATLYARNYVRHEILPRMETLNPGFWPTAARNLNRFAAAHDNLAFLTLQFLGLTEKTLKNPTGFEIDKARLQLLPAPEHALHVLLDPLGFTPDQTRQLVENLTETGLELFAPAASWYVLNDRTTLVIRPTEVAGVRPPAEGLEANQVSIEIRSDDLMVRLGDGRSLFLMPTLAEAPFPDGKEAVVIPSNKLQFPLTLRHWREGDVFQPFGMGGKSQKLQDFFTNHKLSRLEKDAVWLLVNGDGAIIWVLGYRLGEKFKALEGSNALNIKLL